MSLETDVKEKYILIEKLNKEISDLSEQKSQIVKEINVPILEAKEKADKIIADAQTEADTILESAKKVRLEATNNAKKVEELLQSTKEQAKVLDAGTKKLEDNLANFDSKKAGILQEANQIKDDAKKTLAAAEDLRKQTEGLRARLSAKEAELNNKGSSYDQREDRLNQLDVSLTIKQNNINEQLETLAKAKQEIIDIKEANVKILDKTEAKFNEARRIENNNKESLNNLISDRKELEENKQNLNNQFAVLEQSNKNLDEKNKSIDAKNKLLEIKNREVMEKIAILKQLRDKQ